MQYNDFTNTNKVQDDTYIGYGVDKNSVESSPKNDHEQWSEKLNQSSDHEFDITYNKPPTIHENPFGDDIDT